MATQVNIHEAKTTLSKLVDEAVRGGDVVIAKAGKPKVRLVPIGETPADSPKPPNGKRELGFARGRWKTPDTVEDFDRMLDDMWDEYFRSLDTGDPAVFKRRGNE